MKDIKIGEVWYMNFPFEENDGRYKDRPGIIINDLGDGKYAAVKCTSNPNKRGDFDYSLVDPKKAGLVGYGNVRCNKESHVDIRHFRKCIGTVANKDLAIIKLLNRRARKQPNFRYTILEEFLSDCDDEVVLEMSTTNPLDPGFKKKERISLSFFQKIPTTEENVRKYKSQVPSLCHVRTGAEYKGYIYLDVDKVVGYIVVHDDGKSNLREIQALEVAKDYRGCGLSKQLLSVAVHELKANATTVSRSNEITLKINKELGFRTVPRRGNEKMYYQTLGGRSVDSILNEATIDTKQFEFISCPDPDDGVSRAQNSIVRIKGRPFRARVETLIIKDGKIYAQKLDKPNKYGYGCKFPGGGIEPNMSVEDSAQKECNEEARIVVDDLQYTGVSYAVDFNGEYPEWHKKKLWKYGLKYEGTMCYIFVGYYDKEYTGEVEKIDYDDLFKHGEFYDIDELNLLPEHKQALKSYGVIKEEYNTEGAYSHEKYNKIFYPILKKILSKDIANECGGLAGGPGGMVGTQDLSVITQYGYKNSESDEVEGYAVHNDILTANVITTDKKGKVVKENMEEFLQGRKFRMFEYIGKNKSALQEIVNNLGAQEYREYFYETLSGRTLLSDDQILCDEDFKEISPAEINESKNSKIQTIFAEYMEIKETPIMQFPLMNPIDIREANKVIGKHSHVKIFENVNGYFAENAFTRHRTGYFKSIDKVQIGAII